MVGQTGQIEITDQGSSAEIEAGGFPNAWFLQGTLVSSSGTGLIDPFVRFQKNGTEIGYNGDFRPVEYDENTDNNFTDSLLLATVPIVNGLDLDGNGTIDQAGAFYEFRLDLNQGNGGDASFITIDALQIHLGNAGNLTGFNDPGEVGADGFGANSVLIWDLDGGTRTASNFLVLNDIESGSGSADYFFYVPVSAFAGQDPSFTYVYLYSEFGVTSTVTLKNGVDINNDGDTKDSFEAAAGDKIGSDANGGFEEWNINPGVTLEWEKRNEDGTQLIGGATFTVAVDPKDSKASNFVITVTDNGAGDLDPDAGQIKIGDMVEGTFVITEITAPAGWGFDDDVTRAGSIGSKDTSVVIGVTGKDDPGDTDESDFHNRLASLEWEKRSDAGALVGGATFKVEGPNGFVLTVTDGGAGDLDPDAGQIKITDLKIGTYTVTETKAPDGWALDDSVTRTETITLGNFNAVIGTQGSDDKGNGPTDADFHNRLGSLEWEKRNEDGKSFVAGATFEVSGPNGFLLTVTDGGAGDLDGKADGHVKIGDLKLGTYTVTETKAPAGWVLDDSVSRTETITDGNLNASIGTTGQDDAGDGPADADFHNRQGSLEWEKRNEDGKQLVSGATFEVTGPSGFLLTVTDGGAGDLDGKADGHVKIGGLALGTYTVTETKAPDGWALDDSVTRTETITLGNLNASIGATGADDAGNGPADADFHNRLGSLEWEKRNEDGKQLVSGATFEVSGPNGFLLTVTDGGAGDLDGKADGHVKIGDLKLGTYTVTETKAPDGWALDDSVTRTETITAGNLNASIGTSGADDAGDGPADADFHNRLGSLEWEKRNGDGKSFVAGATFEVSGPNGFLLTVTDGGAGDLDGKADGHVKIGDLKLGTYTVTETKAPDGWALDDSVTRTETITEGNLNASIGTTGADDAGNGPADADFHNRLGSLEWEKRGESGVFVPGATFEVSGPNGFLLTVTDGGAGDLDGKADGHVKIGDLKLGTYTVTETKAPDGWALDDSVTRTETLTDGNLDASIGTTGVDDKGDGPTEADFHNRRGSLEWEKRNEDGKSFVAGATFEVTGPSGFLLTVTDGGAGDLDGKADGHVKIGDLALGTYTVTETKAPDGWALDDSVTRTETITDGNLNASIGTSGADDAGNGPADADFHNRLGSLEWEKRNGDGKSFVAGATFEVSGPNGFLLTVTDGGAGDLDGKADGHVKIGDLKLGTYTVTETKAPDGWALDDSVSRTETITDGNLNASIGTNGADDAGNGPADADFHNRLGSLEWEKRNEDGKQLVSGATFEVSGPNGFLLTVTDGGAGDLDGKADGHVKIGDLKLGTYTVTETKAPDGWALDDSVSRTETITDGNLDASIGTSGQDDAGDGPADADFHNRRGSLEWEKRNEDGKQLVSGATFEVSGPNGFLLTVTDGGAGDLDGKADGHVKIGDLALGTYTVTETKAPDGWALDDSVTRTETITDGNLNASIGTSGADDAGDGPADADFHNRLGSLEWEKRNGDGKSFVAGATFEVSGPNGFLLTVTDGGAGDLDGKADGHVKIGDLKLGTYTVTETKAPDGWALDDSVTRTETVTEGNLNASIGVNGADDAGNGPADADFHNRLGSLEWEKRNEDGKSFVAGATFEVSGPNGFLLTVTDGGAGDLDGKADGHVKIGDLKLGTYTVTETKAPDGWALDDSVSRTETITDGNLDASIGTTGADDAGDGPADADFHNRLGSLEWEKRNGDGKSFVAGATFEVSGPNGFLLTVTDGGAGDLDGKADGHVKIGDLKLGTYTVTETKAPDGWALDDSVTRTETITTGNLNASIGTTGADDAGDGPADADFHNRLGSLEWEKRNEDGKSFVAGATFEVSGPNGFLLTVTDGGAGDLDGKADGHVKIGDLKLGTYTVTETKAPDGWALDDSVTRTETITDGNLDASIGTSGADDAGDGPADADFHNRLGSLEWEKRNGDGKSFVAGATFEVSGPNGFLLTVTDGGAGDLDGKADGHVKIGDLKLGTYTVTETKAPDGWALDDSVSRTETITDGNLNASIGTTGQDDAGDGPADADFHNRLGSLEWEKRNEDGKSFVAGATFEVSGPNGFLLTVTDGGAGDLDGKADGHVKIGDLKLGTYTVTETKAPDGWALDDSVSRTETITTGNLNASIGTTGADDAGNGPGDADFHNRLGSLEWEKRNEDGTQLITGATFTVTGPGSFSLTVTDGGAGDLDGKADGHVKIGDLKLGTYTVTETKAPDGWALDDSVTRTETLTDGNLHASIGSNGVDDKGNGPGEADFHNRLGSLEWEKRDDAGGFVGGATFTVTGPNGYVVTLTDNGIFDLDPDAGQFKIASLKLGTYTITETTPPPGYGLDPDPTRVETLTDSNLYAVVGKMDFNDTGTGEDVDFHDPLLLGARTPGFWANPNNGGLFWDGDATNNPKAGTDGFPPGDLLVLGNTLGGPGAADDYILIGDWDGSGSENGTEETIKILRSEALEFLNSSAKDQQDGRFMLMRDLVATWLNKLQGVSTAQVGVYIDEAIDWMTATTPGLSDGVLSTEELLAANAVPTKADAWQLGIDGPDGGAAISGDVNSTDILAGKLLHTYLDNYNNTGVI